MYRYISPHALLGVTIKLLFNAQSFIINNVFSIEGDGHLLEASLFGNNV